MPWGAAQEIAKRQKKKKKEEATKTSFKINSHIIITTLSLL